LRSGFDSANARNFSSLIAAKRGKKARLNVGTRTAAAGISSMKRMILTSAPTSCANDPLGSTQSAESATLCDNHHIARVTARAGRGLEGRLAALSLGEDQHSASQLKPDEGQAMKEDQDDTLFQGGIGQCQPPDDDLWGWSARGSHGHARSHPFRPPARSAASREHLVG
jgi:hypothetical protein